jgi:hypothetical protein
MQFQSLGMSFPWMEMDNYTELPGGLQKLIEARHPGFLDHPNMHPTEESRRTKE